MIRIYERSLCQSYASAYRQGILLAKTDDEAALRTKASRFSWLAMYSTTVLVCKR